MPPSMILVPQGAQEKPKPKEKPTARDWKLYRLWCRRHPR
jgi:hypothetical protein